MALHITDNTEKEIIIESLLLLVDSKNNDLKRASSDAFDDRVASSILRAFLVERHPEFTAELAKFTIEQVKENGYGVDCIASGGVSALEYHRDSIDDKELDAALKELGAMMASKL